MKKSYLIVVCVVALTVVATQAFATYDSAAVKKAMQALVPLMGETSKALEAKDFFTVAEKLMEIAKQFKALNAITPTKADKAEWDRIHGEMIKAAFKGIGACAEENADQVKVALDTLKQYQMQGHKMFK